MTKLNGKRGKVSGAKKSSVKSIDILMAAKTHYFAAEQQSDVDSEATMEQDFSDYQEEPIYTRSDDWFTEDEYEILLASVKKDRIKKAEWRRRYGLPEDNRVPIEDDDIWPDEI
jgi:hypothetical protein